MIVCGHVLVYSHVYGHVLLRLVRDHVIHHVSLSQGHVPDSQDHVGESSSSLSGYNLALGSGRVDLGRLCAIPS